MPKRVPTPPPADDEPRYLTVVYPYAISGTCNMELPKDREDFARWVACCIDKDAFFAIFHKPSSRAMVIIEVNRGYQQYDRILGEHRWSEFLQSPTKEEAGRVTQVFYCTYSTGRIVQKNGWKRIDVDETWFKSWSPRNRQTKFPYPPTHFCDVPVEDRTNLSMCRPLPGAVITPPSTDTVPPPVVGSSEWIDTKEGRLSLASLSLSTQAKPNPLGAWGKGDPKPLAVSAKPNPTAGGSVKRVPVISQAPQAGARRPAIGGGSIAVKSANVWQNTGKKPVSTPVASNWEDSPPVSGMNTPVSRAVSPPIVPRANASQSLSPHDPSLTFPIGTASLAPGGPDRTGNYSASSWDSTGTPTSSPDSDSGPDLTTATESDNPHSIRIHFSESMEEEFHGIGIKMMDDHDGELGGLDVMAPMGTWDEPADLVTWEPTGGGWNDEPLEAEDVWRQNNTEAPKPMLCKAHGIICKKGICAEYAQQLRVIKRAEEAEKRKNEIANRGKKGKGRGAGKKKGDKESNKDETQNNGNGNPNLFRGPGAPVRTNWRGAPRAIVTADAVEKPETVSEDAWGNSDSETGPNVAVVEPANNTDDTTSNASWGMSESAYNPWASGVATTKTTNRPGGKPLGKKPGQTNASSSWADQVDAELGAGDAHFTAVNSKRGAKRGKGPGSGAGWSSSAKFSSTGGRGTVPGVPW